MNFQTSQVKNGKVDQKGHIARNDLSKSFRIFPSRKKDIGNTVIAMDGTSASGKSTNARRVAESLGFVYVDTGAMYRTLAWHALQSRIELRDSKAISRLCQSWKTKLMCIDGAVRLLVNNYFPEKEIRTAETSAAVPYVAAIQKVRDWMKKKQRACLEFGSLVMEGRDIGSNVFPQTNYKFYLDASLNARSRRREADGVKEDLCARDKRDSQRSAAPLIAPLGAIRIDTSKQTPEESSALILKYIRDQMKRDLTKGD